MIAVGQEQHLGRKTFLLILSRKTTTAMVLFMAAIIILAIGPNLSLGIAGVMALGGTVSMGSADGISGAISYISMLLFLVGVIAFLMGFIVASLQYRNYSFMLDEFGVKVRRGIFSQKEISVPYRQIQDVDIIRSFSYRMMGVSKLVMITAGHEDKGEERDGTDSVLDPIDSALAQEIRSFLDQKIGVQITESTVQADREEKKEEHAPL